MAIDIELLETVASGNVDPVTGLQSKNKGVNTVSALDEDLVDITYKNPVPSVSVGAGYLGLNPDKYRRYGGIPSNIKDLEEYRATNQSVGEQFGLGMTRLVSTFATKFLTQAGFLATAVPALVTWDINKMVDNSFSAFFSALEEDLKEDILPIYHKRKYLDGNIFNQMGTFSFYADDVVDGLAFMAASVVGAKGLNTAGSGIKGYTALAKASSKGLRAAKLGKMTKGMTPSLKKTAKFMDLSTISAFNSVAEAALEAKGVKDEILAGLSSKIGEGEMTEEEANLIASNAAKNTFWWNATALMPSNMLTNALVFKKFRSPLLGMSGGAGTEVKPMTLLQKAGVFGKSSLASVASEGLYEENIQTAITSFEKLRAMSDPDAEFSAPIIEILNGMVENLFTDEGQKSIVLGGIVGLFPGGAAGVSTARSENKRRLKLQAASAQFLENYKENAPTKIYKTKDSLVAPGTQVLDLGKDGKPQLDVAKVQALAAGLYDSYASLAASAKALEDGSEFMFEFIRNKNLSKVVAGFYSLENREEDFTEWLDFQIEDEKKQLADAGFEGDAEFYSNLKNDYANLATEYFSFLDQVENNFAGLTSLPNTDAGKAFRGMLKSEQYDTATTITFLESKLEEYNKKLLSAKIEGNTALEEGLNSAISALEEVVKETQNKLKDLLNHKKQESRFKEQLQDLEEITDTRGATSPEVSTTHVASDSSSSSSGTIKKSGDHIMYNVSNTPEAVDFFDERVAKANGYNTDEAVTGESSVYFKVDKEAQTVHTIVTDADNNVVRDTLTVQKDLYSLEDTNKKEVGINFVNGELESVKVKDVKSGKISEIPTKDFPSYSAAQIDSIVAHLESDHFLTETISTEEIDYNTVRSIAQVKQELKKELQEEKGKIAESIKAQAEEFKKELMSEDLLEDDSAAASKYFVDPVYDSVKLSDLFKDKGLSYLPVIREGIVGLLMREGDNIIFKKVEKNSLSYSVLVGTAEGSATFSESGIRVLASLPFEFQFIESLNEFRVQGVVYRNGFKKATDAIKYDTEGIPLSVTLQNPEGTKVTFTNPFLVSNLSYILELTEHIKQEYVEKSLLKGKDYFMIKLEDKDYAVYPTIRGGARFVDPSTNRPITGKRASAVMEMYDKEIFKALNKLSSIKLNEVTNTKQEVYDEIRKLIPIARSATPGEAVDLPSAKKISDFKGLPEDSREGKPGLKEEQKLLSELAEKAALAEKALEIQNREKEEAERLDRAADVSTLPGFEEISESFDDSFVPDTGIKHSATAIAYVWYDENSGGYKVNNSDFHDKAIKSDVSEISFTPVVDDKYTEFWEKNASLKDSLASGAMTEEEADKILESSSDTEFSDPVDLIPIKLIAEIAGEVFDNGIYMHTSQYSKISMPDRIKNIADPKEQLEEYKKHRIKEQLRTRNVRRQILKRLLTGKYVAFSASNKTLGYPNNVGKNSNVLDILSKVDSAVDARRVTLAVGTRPGMVYIGKEELSNVTANVAKGNVFLQTSYTANGKEALIKLNPSKLSKEHALIVFNALVQAYSKGKGGFNGTYLGNNVTGDLSCLEVLNLLVYYSEENTKINPKDKRKKHLLPKQLYVDKRYVLHFGENSMHLFTKDANEIQRFVDWAMQNKNYTINKSALGRQLSTNKGFSVGSFKYDPLVDNYNSFILKNGIVLTDVDVVSDTGSLFKEPVIGIDLASGGIDFGNDQTSDSSSSAVPSEDSSATPVGTSEKDLTKENPDVDASLFNKKQHKLTDTSKGVSSLPLGSVLYVPIKEGNSITRFPVGKVVFSTGSGKAGLKLTPNLNHFLLKKLETLLKRLNSFAFTDSASLSTFDSIVKRHPDALYFDSPARTVADTADSTEDSFKPESGGIEAKVKAAKTEEPSIEPANPIEGVVKNAPGRKGITAEQKAKMLQDEVKDASVNKLPNPLNRKGPKKLDDLFNPFNREVSWARDSYTKVDIKAEIEALNRRLRANRWGKPIRVDLVSKLIEIASNRHAFAQFRHDAFVLSELAETGSLMHEAFHRVSLGYLTAPQRESIYEEAREKHFAELKELYKSDTFTDSQVEEYLAEKYRDYSMLKQHDAKSSPSLGLGKKALEFFKNLFEFIYTWFTGNTRLDSYDIETLFSAIDAGRFKFARMQKDNLENLKGKAYNFEIKETVIDTIQSSEEFREVVSNLFFLLAQSNRLVEASNVTGDFAVKLSSFDDVKRIKFGPLYKTVRRLALEHSDIAEANDLAANYLRQGVTKEELAEIQKEYLGDQSVGESIDISLDKLRAQADTASRIASIFGEIYEKFDVFKEAVEDFMGGLNITAIKSDSDIDIVDVDEETGSNMSDYDRYNKTSYMVSSKENTSLSIKLLLSMLPKSNERSKLTGLYTFAEFSPTWSNVINNVIGANSVEEMLDILKRMSTDNITYQSLVKKLESDETLKTQFYEVMQKQKHDFHNILVRTDEDGAISYRFVSASIFQTSSRHLQDWNSLFVRNKKVFNISDKGVLKGNVEYFDSLIEAFDKILLDSNRQLYTNGVISDLGTKIDSLAALLDTVNIPVNSDIIRKALLDLNGITESHSFVELITKKIPYIFSDTSSLRKILNGEIIKDAKGKNVSPSKVFQYEKGISYLADIYTRSNIAEVSDSVFGPQGNRYYTIAQNTYMSDIVRELKENPTEFLKLLESDLYSQHSQILRALRENPSIADKISIATVSSFQREDRYDTGREYQELTPVEDVLMRVLAVESGMLVPPTPADRRFFYFFKGLDLLNVNVSQENKINDAVLDVYAGYVQDEIDRIRRVRREVDLVLKGEMNSEDLFETYHFKKLVSKENDRQTDVANGIVDGKILKIGDKYVGNGANFTDFVGMELDMSLSEIKSELNKILIRRIEDTLDMFVDLGIIEKHVTENQVLYTNKLLDKAWVKKYETLTGDPNSAIINLVANFAVNVSYSSIEINKVFTGDPAAFKNSEDNVKRLPAYTSTGSNLRPDFPSSYYPGDRLVHSDTYSVTTFTSQVVESEMYQPLVDFHVKYYMENGLAANEEEAREIANSKLKGLLKSDRTDAQTFISPELYRAISIKLGKWGEPSGAKETAYKLLQSGKDLSKEESIRLFEIVMEPLKMTYMDIIHRNGHKVPVLDKMSMATLFRPVVKGTKLEKLLDRMEAKGEYEGLPPIDQVKFHTAEKVGIKDRRDFFTDASESEITNLSVIPQYNQRFSRLRYQLVTDPHDVSTTLVGSQVKKIGMANIFPENDYSLEGLTDNGKIKGTDLRKHINELLGELSTRGKDSMFESYGIDKKDVKFSSLERLAANLREEAKKAKIPDYIIENLKISEDGKLHLEIDSFPGNRTWIQSRLISVIKKASIDLFLPGNVFIQMSDIGLQSVKTSESLKMLNANGFTEARVSTSLFKSIIPNYEALTHEERVKYLKDRPELTSLCYRIPTQAPSSVYLIEVVEFLPGSVGNVIILPKEGPALGGFDFDIDKLYVLRHNYKKGEKVRYLHNYNSTEKERIESFTEDALKSELHELRKDAYIKISEISAHISDYKEGISYAKDVISELVPYLELNLDIAENIQKIREQKEIKRYNYKKLNESIEEINSIKTQLQEKTKELKDRWIEDNKETFFNRTIMQQNTKAAVENRLLDSYFSVMRDTNHIVRRTTPLGYAAGMMKDLSLKVREWKGISEETGAPLARTFPKYQMDVKSRYKFGSEGLGPNVLAMSNHILGQSVELGLFSYIGIGNKDSNENTDLSQILGEDGIDITEWFSGLVDAHVDVAADPFAYYLNINELTRNVISLLLRAGVGGEAVFLFSSQPVLSEIASAMENNGNRLGLKKSAEDYAEIKMRYKRSFLALKSETPWRRFTVVDIPSMLSAEHLTSLLKGPKNTAEFYNAQHNILEAFEFFESFAEYLKEATMASRVDTKKFGSSYSEVLNFKNRILKTYVNSQNEVGIKNIRNLLEDTFLAPYMSNSIDVIESLFSGVVLEATPSFSLLVNEVLKLTGNLFTLNPRVITNISNEVYTSIYADFFREIGLTGEKATELTTGENSIPRKIQNIKAGNYMSEIRDNPLFSIMFPVIPEEGPHVIAISKPDNKWHKDDISRGWKDLFSGDIKHRNLAIDLFMYSFLTSGFKGGLHVFHDLVPPSLTKFLGLDSFIKKELQRLNSGDFELITKLDEIFTNNWSDDTLVKNVKKLILQKNIESGNKVVVFQTWDSSIFRGYNSENQPIYSPFVLTSSRNLYKYIGYDPSNENAAVYAIVNKKGYRNAGHTIREDSFDDTLFKDNKSGLSPSVLSQLTPEGFPILIGSNAKVHAKYSGFIPVTDRNIVRSVEDIENAKSSKNIAKLTRINYLSLSQDKITEIADGAKEVTLDRTDLQGLYTLDNGLIVYLEKSISEQAPGKSSSGATYNVSTHGYTTPSKEEVNSRIKECK